MLRRVPISQHPLDLNFKRTLRAFGLLLFLRFDLQDKLLRNLQLQLFPSLLERDGSGIKFVR